VPRVGDGGLCPRAARARRRDDVHADRPADDSRTRRLDAPCRSRRSVIADGARDRDALATSGLAHLLFFEEAASAPAKRVPGALPGRHVYPVSVQGTDGFRLPWHLPCATAVSSNSSSEYAVGGIDGPGCAAAEESRSSLLRYRVALLNAYRADDRSRAGESKRG